MSQDNNNNDIVLKPQLLRDDDRFVHKLIIDNNFMKKIFKEFVESNPEYVKEVLKSLNFSEKDIQSSDKITFYTPTVNVH